MYPHHRPRLLLCPAHRRRQAPLLLLLPRVGEAAQADRRRHALATGHAGTVPESTIDAAESAPEHNCPTLVGAMVGCAGAGYVQYGLVLEAAGDFEGDAAAAVVGSVRARVGTAAMTRRRRT